MRPLLYPRKHYDIRPFRRARSEFRGELLCGGLQLLLPKNVTTASATLETSRRGKRFWRMVALFFTHGNLTL